MRLIDLLEGYPLGRIRDSVVDTLPPIAVIPQLDNGNLYLNYRFGTTLAAALSVAKGEHPYSKQVPWHTMQSVAPYSPQELEIVKLAAQQSGFTVDMLHDSDGREPDWVNTVSPVARLPMLEAAGDDTFKQPKTPLIHNLSPADDKAISYQDTPTRGKPQIVVVYPGRFQPLHRGHKAVYDDLVAEFGPNVYIATSNKTDPDKSPFDFEDKLRMARAAGIPADKIQLVKNPYSASEITDRFVPENTVLLFAVGEKDMDTDPRFKFDEKGQAYKKDGSLAYLQKWPGMHKAKTMDQHGYIIAAPTKEFTVLGEPATSATEIRKAYRSADPATRDGIITDLYGKPKPDIRRMFDDKLGAKIDEDQPTYLPNPLDPEGDTNGPGKTGDQWTEGEVVQFPGKYNYKTNDKANVAQAAGNVAPLARRPAGPDLQNFHAAKNIATQIFWEEASFDYTDESAQDLAELYDELEKMGYTTEDATGDDMGQKITHIASKRSYTIGEDELLSVAEAEVWDKPNPVKKHKHLSDKDKAAARARAKRAGRKWPNMVDNIWAARR
jgi:Cytidylyltransferase-like